MRRLKRLDLCRPADALAVVMLARLMWGAWATLLSGLLPYTMLETVLRLWPPQPGSGMWWHRAVVSPWMRYDFEYYERIISLGYRADDGSSSFHPLYAMLGKAIFALTRSVHLSLLLAATLSAWAATLLIARYTRRFHGERLATATGWVFVLNPLGWVLIAPYTEGTFLALCIGSIWAMRERRFWLSATLAALATLTRQQGVLLLAPLAAMLWQAREPLQEPQLPQTEPQVPVRARRHHLYDWLCLALIPAAYIGFSLFRLHVVGEALTSGRGVGAYIASWLVSPSAQLVVRGAGLAAPWRPIIDTIRFIPIMPAPYTLFIDALGGWAMIAILARGWKFLHLSEKWLCAGVTLAATCFYSVPYMGFPRHMMLAFPLSFLVARWSLERGRVRLLLEVMALASLLLCAAFVRHSWVP